MIKQGRIYSWTVASNWAGSVVPRSQTFIPTDRPTNKPTDRPNDWQNDRPTNRPTKRIIVAWMWLKIQSTTTTWMMTSRARIMSVHENQDNDMTQIDVMWNSQFLIEQGNYLRACPRAGLTEPHVCWANWPSCRADWPSCRANLPHQLFNLPVYFTWLCLLMGQLPCYHWKRTGPENHWPLPFVFYCIFVNAHLCECPKNL